MPEGTAGSLLFIAVCIAAAAWCFDHVVWPLAPSFTQVLWIVAGVLFLLVGLFIAALLVTAKMA